MNEDLLGRLRAALADRYQVEAQIGRGGMATVFRARDLKHDRLVAIKVLHPELAATLGSERFLREIQIAAKLNHPHILPLHDSGEAHGFLFHVMPLVEGESLRERLNREKQLAVDDAVQIAHDFASALDYAHGHDVIHRDIKPENVLLEAGGAFVTDFGIVHRSRRAPFGGSAGLPAAPIFRGPKCTAQKGVPSTRTRGEWNPLWGVSRCQVAAPAETPSWCTPYHLEHEGVVWDL